MPHAAPLISTIVGGLVLAFVFGAIANRLRLPPLVGYLLAGILVGPHTPGFVADQSLAPQLAEIGVILLMFGVGLHFSLKDLLSVRMIAVPGAVVQIAVATLFGWAFGWYEGWSMGGSLVFGLSLSVASTVVLLKAMQERRLIDTERGRVAVGWLIVEDLAMVMTLVLIPAFASVGGEGGHGDPLAAVVARMLGVELGLIGIVLLTLVKVAAFVALMLLVGRRGIPWLLHRIAHSGSRELFRLGVLAIALGVAFGASELFGVSLALGAFFAGMVLSESELSHRAAQESLPLRDAFSVLFFVSVGMMFDPSILAEAPWALIGTVAIIIVGKSVAAFLIVIAFRRPAGMALTISASLAQIGEFSFILAELGVGLGLLPEEGRSLILAGAIISIILNPAVFWLCGQLRPLIEARWVPKTVATAPAGDAPAASATEAAAPAAPVAAAMASEDEPLPTTLTGHTVLVGFGRVGGLVGASLKAEGRPLLVIEDADQRVAQLRAAGIDCVVGNAAAPEVLTLANLAAAEAMVIAIPQSFEAGQVAQQARVINPSLRIIARSHSDEETDYLARHGADRVIMGEREIASGMLAYLADLRPDAPAATGGEASADSPAAPVPA